MPALTLRILRESQARSPEAHELEEEGKFPQADYAFDNGVLTLELTRLIESKGKHWVSELESSHHILWQDQWRRIDEVAMELREQHPEGFRRVSVKLSQHSF